MRMIDPPDGAAYGFPKPFDGREGQSIDDWLIEHGYPIELVRRFPRGVPVRIYERNPNSEDSP